jgi:hypothetical protein
MSPFASVLIFMTDVFSCVRPHPPVIRALRHAEERLRAARIKLVDWEPYKHGHGWDIIVSNRISKEMVRLLYIAMPANEKKVFYVFSGCSS